MLSYQQVIDVGLSPDAQTLQDRLAAATAALGFGLSGGTHIRGRLESGRAQVNAIFNTPPEFIEASRSAELGMADPFLNAMLASPGVHVYDEAYYRKAGADGLWDLISAYGYRHGLAVAIHEPAHAEMFTFGVDGPDALPAGASARLELQVNVQLLAMHAHEAAKRLWTLPPEVDLNAVTAEEVGALKWARDGVCVWVTGDKLVYSNPGLVAAQGRAARKLGGSGPAAVLTAIEGGLLDR